MRKAALLAAVTLTAALFAAPSIAAPKADPAIAAQKNSADLMRDAFNPYEATSKLSAKPSARHHHRSARHAKKKSKKS